MLQLVTTGSTSCVRDKRRRRIPYRLSNDAITGIAVLLLVAALTGWGWQYGCEAGSTTTTSFSGWMALGVTVLCALVTTTSIIVQRLYSTPTLHNRTDAALRKDAFLQKAGDAYGYRQSKAGFIDDWRPRELPSLLHPHHRNHQAQQEVYLDYAGAALPWQSQLRQQQLAHNAVYANPHSTGPAAARTARAMEVARKRVLDWLDGHAGRYAGLTTTNTTDTNHHHNMDTHPGYELVWTSGTTDALRLVATYTAWSGPCPTCGRPGSQLVHPTAAHTSLVGMTMRGSPSGTTTCVPTRQLVTDLPQRERPSWVYTAENNNQCPQCAHRIVPNLLALPLECNFGGDKMDSWSSVRNATWMQADATRPWWTLLDLAKAVATGPVSLRQLNPDFATLSFYKVFGSPTGLGCLLVKRSIVSTWLGQPTEQARYYGGGAVDLVLPRRHLMLPRSAPSLLASLQSGTVHFRGIVELPYGFDVIEQLGGMKAIQRHTQCLVRELVTRLRALKHANGKAVVKLYGSWACENVQDAGPTVAFNLQRQDGSYVGYNEVAKLAALNRPCPIQLRVGCLCNPGACQEALQLDEDQVLENYRKTGHVCGDDIDIIDGMPTGVVRASLGKDSTWEDLDALVCFVERVFVATAPSTETSWDGAPRQVVVEEQYIFPIKSCAAQRVPEWMLNTATSRLAYDREFALVDSSGTAMRLQRYPQMAFIEPTVSLTDQTMTVRAPGMPPLEIHLTATGRRVAYGEGIIRVCGNKCSGVLWGDLTVAQWFSDFLQVQCWLARYSDGNYELPDGGLEVDDDNDDDGDGTIPQTPSRVVTTKRNPRKVAFANEQPLLLISKQAVDLLNDVLASQKEGSVTSRHFRPNFVVSMTTDQDGNDDSNKLSKLAHAEDGWTRVRYQNRQIALRVVGPCARCAMVDVDPRSGTKGHGTLRALADYRRRQHGQINFGIFLQGTSHNGVRQTWVREGDVLVCE